MERSNILSSARLAGDVLRYHTWPTLQSQTVAAHTWNVLRIYWQIFGPPVPNVTTYIIWHDAGELVPGDVPFPAKANNSVLKSEHDRLEVEAVVSMGGPQEVHLSARERARIKVCDLTEMMEFGRHELALGNTYAQPIVDDTLRAIEVLLINLPKEDCTQVEAYVRNCL